MVVAFYHQTKTSMDVSLVKRGFDSGPLFDNKRLYQSSQLEPTSSFYLNGYGFMDMGDDGCGGVFEDLIQSANWVIIKDFSFNIFFTHLAMLFVK